MCHLPGPEQDGAAAALLRHLCLCQACTEIPMRLPRLPPQLPTSRLGILQTLNVYL